MSFNTIHECANDAAFHGRLTACCAAEINARDETREPDLVMYLVRWPVAAMSDIEAAYASALAAGNPNPGGDEAVITDQMILSAVQANWPPPPA